MGLQQETSGVLPPVGVNEDGLLTVEIPHGFQDGVGKIDLGFLGPAWGWALPPVGDGVEVMTQELQENSTILHCRVVGYRHAGRKNLAALSYRLTGPRAGPSALGSPTSD
jgi:hypothetical protein